MTHPKPVLIIDCGSKKTSDINDIVSDICSFTQVIALNQANTYPFEQARCLIISGGPHLFTESEEKHQELMQLFQFIENLELPTLGICLGHQAIALTFGGKVYRDRERRESDNIKRLKHHPLFNNLRNPCEFSEDHCEGIWPSNKIDVLAQSEFYETEAIKVINRPFLGVQFHPETSGQNGFTLIKNFLEWAETQQQY